MSYYNPEIHHRRSIRLNGYDYSKKGLYFITCCCQNREHFFGEIVDGEMILNDAGKMIEREWLSLTDRFIHIYLHEFVIMPNHFHGIMEVVGATLVVAQDPQEIQTLDSLRIIERGQPQGIAPTDTQTDTSTDTPTIDPTKAPTIGDIISAFKSITTVRYIEGVKTYNWQRFNKKLWQRNYYEHIIRDEIALNNIANYIIENPKRWNDDRFR